MLQSSLLATTGNIRHAFFTREGGVSDGIYASLNGGIGSRDQPAHVGENRTRMATQVGVAPDHLLSLYQIHSPDVVVVETPWTVDQRPRADAMVTRQPGLALGISTADCGPVLFADAEAGVIGAAHAGWKGAFTGVLEATLDAMVAQGAERSRIAVALGPMIRQQSYEVGAEFVEKFVATGADNTRFFAPGAREGHAQFDLPGYIASRLTRAGISRIDDLGLCTYADGARFYSYRRSCHRAEPDYGRHISAIALNR